MDIQRIIRRRWRRSINLVWNYSEPSRAERKQPIARASRCPSRTSRCTACRRRRRFYAGGPRTVRAIVGHLRHRWRHGNTFTALPAALKPTDRTRRVFSSPVCIPVRRQLHGGSA